MALVVADRVQETSVTSGTGTLTLAGALAGFQTFSIGIGNGNTTFYTIYDSTLYDWEVGIGTVGAGTLSRDTVLSNSAGTTSPISFSGNSKFVFCTYPSEKSVNLNALGNVSPLGTISSGTWQGTTVGVAYGGTGVTASSGANSVVLRDSNQNITVNRVNQSNTTTTSTGGTTALTAASSYIHTLVSTNSQTYTLPDATTLTTGVAFLFNNLATGNLIIEDYANGPLGTIPSGGAGAVFLTANATVAGTWDLHGYLPEGVTWGTNALNLGTSVITGGTWNGGTIDVPYGGTGLTTFSAANNALYSTGATTLTAGTLPIAAGGTGQTTANTALNALLPNQATNSGRYLTTDGTNSSWATVTQTTFSAGTTGFTPSSPTSGTVTLAGTLNAVNGGTGIATYTTGDIIYASATNTLAKLGAGSNGQILTLASGVPTWAASSAATARTVSNFTATAGQTTFTVAYTVGYIDVFRNGVKLAGSDYVATNGTSIVLSVGANVGDIIETVAYSALSIGTAGVNSFSAGTTGLSPTFGTGDITLGGTLNVASGGTGVSTSTGTGSVVLSIAPTLNSCIFTSQSNFAAGTAGLPAITTTGDSNTGIFFPAADTIAFAEGGTESMRLDSSGNLALGTTSPTGRLTISQSTNGNAFVVNAPGGSNSNFIMQGSGEQTFRLFNNDSTGSTRTSIKLASRLNTDWDYIIFTDGTGTGVNSLTISNLAGVAFTISANRIVSDFKGDLRSAPIQSRSSSYVITATDAGQTIYISTGGVTFNASVLSAGDMVTIVNNSASAQTITAGASVTFRLAGTATTGSRTLGQFGMATFLCVEGGPAPVFYCSGGGLT